jgi:hypothetical protein
MRHRTYYRLSIGFALAAFGICLALPHANAQNIFYTGFENITASNQQGWIISQGLWQLSAPTNLNGPGAAYDGRICAWTGGDADGSTPAGGQSYLISPLITLPSCSARQQIILSFWQWFSQSQNGHMSV